MAQAREVAREMAGGIAAWSRRGICDQASVCADRALAQGAPSAAYLRLIAFPRGIIMNTPLSRARRCASPSPAAPPASAWRWSRAFARAAPRVAFVARHARRGRAVAAELAGTPRHRRRRRRARTDTHRIALQVAGALGGLDVLVNNASALGPVPLALLADTDCEDLERALATNLVGPFRLTKALLGALAASAREGRGALVVNISSDAAVNAYPLGRLRREQGGAAASEPDLERGAGRRGVRVPVARSGRHGHAAARARRARRGSARR